MRHYPRLVVDNSRCHALEIVKRGRVDNQPALRRLLQNREAPFMRNVAPHEPLLPVRFGHAKLAGDLADDPALVHAPETRTVCPKRQDRLWRDKLSMLRNNPGMPKTPTLQEAKERLGKRLAILRDGMEISQEDFAAALGISQTRYSKYESGRSQPPLDILIGISNLTGQSLDFIVAGRPPALKEVGDEPPLERAG